MDQQQINYYNHLHFKLALRRYLLKQRDTRASRGLVLNNFRQVSLELIDEVVNACVAEGLITITTGNKQCQIYTWHDQSLTPEVTR